jgi:signal transduction histidine kinase
MLSLGLVVLKNRKGKLGWMFFFISMSFVIWTMGTFMMFISKSDSGIIFWDRFVYLGVSFMPALQYHFSLLLGDFTERRKKLLAAAYALSVFFMIISQTDYFVNGVFHYRWGAHTEARIMHHFFVIFFFFFFCQLLYVLYQQYKISRIKIEKQRLTMIIVAFAVLNLLGGLAYLPAYQIPVFSPIPLLAPSLFYFIIAYAIIRYRFMDIRIAVRKTFVYFGLAFFTFFFLSIFLWFFGVFSTQTNLTNTYLVVILAAILFTVCFYYTEKILIKAANKYFFAGLYNYQETIKNLSRELTYYNNLEEIINLIAATIKKTIQLDHLGILLIGKSGKESSLEAVKIFGFDKKNIQDLFSDRFLIGYLEKNHSPLVVDEFLLFAKESKEKSEKANFEKIYKKMNRAKISLCLPLVNKERLIGLIFLSEKFSGGSYSSEDLELLSVLSDQAGIAIDNAQLYKQVKDFNIVLRQKVSEQTGELRNKAAELEEKNKNLNRLLEIKNDFLRLINHQLNTPISIIKNSIYMIKSGSFPPEKGLVFIEDSTKRLEDIFNDFWKAFSFEGEGVKLNYEKTDLEKILDELVRDAVGSGLVKERGLAIKINKNIEIPKVKSDPKQLTQAINNILENAISYTSAGSVTISFERPDDDIFKVLVEDTGCGIDEEDKEKLFEKFIRGKRAIQERPAGSGLGLYIAKKIIEAGGGELKLERTEVDKGSTFSFTVPVWK